MIYSFEEYELDLQCYELPGSGRPIKIGPQVFNLLAYLIQHRDRLATDFKQSWRLGLRRHCRPLQTRRYHQGCSRVTICIERCCTTGCQTGSGPSGIAISATAWRRAMSPVPRSWLSLVALEHLEQALALYRPAQHRTHLELSVYDPGVI